MSKTKPKKVVQKIILPPNIYQLPNGQLFRCINERILVERVPIPGTDHQGMRLQGGVWRPLAHREDPTAIGIVRAVGFLHKHPKLENGERTQIRVQLDIEVGMRCAFLWFYAETQTNQMISEILGDNFVLLKWEDIGLCWPDDENHMVSDIRSLGR